MPENLLGVIGSGTMGHGIAQTAAQAGWQALLYDIAPAQLEWAIADIKRALNKRVAKGKMTNEELAAILDRIKTTSDLTDLADCSVVVESVVEKQEVKSEVLARAEAIVSPQALLATNTSSLPIVEIANGLQDPSRLVGIHFFNPVPAMKLVEIVQSVVVDAAIVARAEQFAQELGKETILAQDTPGFIVNYLQYPFRLNAIRMVESGLATVEEIDKAAKLALGHPMGPFELQDMVGLDVTYNAVTAVYNETKDPSLAPPVLLKRMVAAGHLGRKTGRGFYDYSKNGEDK